MSMKAGNIAVFGGNGLTGSECVYQALERGDSVTAFCRDPSKLVVRGPVGLSVCLSVYLSVLSVCLSFFCLLSPPFLPSQASRAQRRIVEVWSCWGA